MSKIYNIDPQSILESLRIIEERRGYVRRSGEMIAREQEFINHNEGLIADAEDTLSTRQASLKDFENSIFEKYRVLSAIQMLESEKRNGVADLDGKIELLLARVKVLDARIEEEIARENKKNEDPVLAAFEEADEDGLRLGGSIGRQIRLGIL